MEDIFFRLEGQDLFLTKKGSDNPIVAFDHKVLGGMPQPMKSHQCHQETQAIKIVKEIQQCFFSPRLTQPTMLFPINVLGV